MQYPIGKYISVSQTSRELSIKFRRNVIVSIGVLIPFTHMLFVGLTIYLVFLVPESKFYNHPIFIIILLSLPISVWITLSELSLSYEILINNYCLSLTITRLNKKRTNKISTVNITSVQRIDTLTRFGAGEGTRWPKICFFENSKKNIVPMSKFLAILRL
jgi:hypothetical protein